MLGPCYVMYYVVFYLVCIHLAWEERADCSSWCNVNVIDLCLFPTVLLIGLQCVIVAYHAYTHVCLNVIITSKFHFINLALFFFANLRVSRSKFLILKC